MKIALAWLVAAHIALACLFSQVCLAAVPPSEIAAFDKAFEKDVATVGHEVPIDKNAPELKGKPVTAVAITQCNLIVVVYLTMPDGRLLRFDKSNQIPASELLAMAYSAVRSERVEVGCDSNGVVGYERHDPV